MRCRYHGAAIDRHVWSWSSHRSHTLVILIDDFKTRSISWRVMATAVIFLLLFDRISNIVILLTLSMAVTIGAVALPWLLINTAGHGCFFMIRSISNLCLGSQRSFMWANETFLSIDFVDDFNIAGNFTFNILICLSLHFTLGIELCTSLFDIFDGSAHKFHFLVLIHFLSDKLMLIAWLREANSWSLSTGLELLLAQTVIKWLLFLEQDFSSISNHDFYCN